MHECAQLTREVQEAQEALVDQVDQVNRTSPRHSAFVPFHHSLLSRVYFLLQRGDVRCARLDPHQSAIPILLRFSESPMVNFVPRRALLTSRFTTLTRLTRWPQRESRT